MCKCPQIHLMQKVEVVCVSTAGGATVDLYHTHTYAEASQESLSPAERGQLQSFVCADVDMRSCYDEKKKFNHSDTR